jgi:hypothetical protein
MATAPTPCAASARTSSDLARVVGLRPFQSNSPRLNPQQLIPCRRVAGRQQFPAQLPWPAPACDRERDGIPAKAAVEPVDRAHQRLAARHVSLVELPFLNSRGRMEIEQNDAGLLIAVAVTPDRVKAGERCGDQLAAVTRRHRQPHRPRGVNGPEGTFNL